MNFQGNTMENNVQNQLGSIKDNAIKDFTKAQDSTELYNFKVQYLGKSGALTEAMKLMAALPKEEKPLFGKLVNEVKAELETLYSELEEKIKNKEIDAKMQNEKLDLSFAAASLERGHEHPIFKVTNEIVSIMSRLGYSLRTGPLIEKDYYNFEALNIPPNHPARDMQDTFFVDDSHVLRTHTSPIQIHSLENEKPPLRIIGTGSVFRCDSDISHLPNFHQIEGMCVDEKVSMADLKGTISFFVKEFFGSNLQTRFRPSFFPFTEPSAEVDIGCKKSKESLEIGKGDDWLEVLGCGMVHPNVLRNVGLDPNEWQGFAFGMGVERLAMLKYGIPDLRAFYETDLRWLKNYGFRALDIPSLVRGVA
jgi:phenylalanyl-tRNA synthetase alpha chain